MHFTGSTDVFHTMWQPRSRDNLDTLPSYPRLVGETGGKDFVARAPVGGSAARSLTALVRGGYEYQGQKCSAASRAYVAESVWKAMKDELIETVNGLTIGRRLGLHELHGRGDQEGRVRQARPRRSPRPATAAA